MTIDFDALREVNGRFLNARAVIQDELERRECSGAAVCLALSAATDTWLLGLWDICGPAIAGQFVAVGGYGRDELCLHSDVDVVLHLQQDHDDPELRVAVEALVTAARETRVKLALAVRSRSQLEPALKEDGRTAISYLEARPLSGGRDEFSAREIARTYLLRDDGGLSLVGEMVAGFSERRERFGQTIYRLEPDIKSGPGGLRDLQSLRWSALVRFDRPIGNAEDEPDWGDAEELTFQAALDWLLEVRQHLHRLHGRRHDRMNFDDQENLAQALGYGEDVEELMQHHYRLTKSLAKLTERMLRKWSVGEIPFSEMGHYFRVGAGQIGLKSTVEVFEPLKILEALQIASDKNVLLAPGLELMAEEAVSQWDHETAFDLTLSSRLRDLLTDVAISPNTSTRLLDLGVLPRIVPEFAPIVCHMQHDVYHVYTTDVHSLRCLEVGRSAINKAPGSIVSRWPWLGAVVDQIDDTAVFLLSCLFHDIGKNRGGGHSRKGAAFMRDIGPRMGLSDEQVDQLSWLVLEHLTLSQTARRRDISNPALITQIAASVSTTQNLNKLLLLTFCDGFTVGDGVLTDWTAKLLEELYRRVLGELQGDGMPDIGEQLWDALEQEYDVDPVLKRRFRRELPSRALRDLDVGSLHRFFLAYETSMESQRPSVFFYNEPMATTTELMIATQDQPGTLALISGTLVSMGVEILDAQIISTPGGQVLDKFRVSRLGRPITEAGRIDDLTRVLEEVLTGKTDVETLLSQKRNKLPPRPRPSVETEIQEVDEPGVFTILEVRTQDRAGLLHILASALQQADVNIHMSKIDSEGDRAIDTFYVEEIGGGRLSGKRTKEVIAKIEEALS